MMMSWRVPRRRIPSFSSVLERESASKFETSWLEERRCANHSLLNVRAAFQWFSTEIFIPIFSFWFRVFFEFKKLKLWSFIEMNFTRESLPSCSFSGIDLLNFIFSLNKNFHREKFILEKIARIMKSYFRWNLFTAVVHQGMISIMAERKNKLFSSYCYCLDL